MSQARDSRRLHRSRALTAGRRAAVRSPRPPARDPRPTGLQLAGFTARGSMARARGGACLFPSDRRPGPTSARTREAHPNAPTPLPPVLTSRGSGLGTRVRGSRSRGSRSGEAGHQLGEQGQRPREPGQPISERGRPKLGARDAIARAGSAASGGALREPRAGSRGSGRPGGRRGSTIRERRSTIRERRSTIRERRSTIRERRSTIRERESTIREPEPSLAGSGTARRARPSAGWPRFRTQGVLRSDRSVIGSRLLSARSTSTPPPPA